MHPYLMPLATLEEFLMRLYALVAPTEPEYLMRADMARAYHDRTGRYFAARFY